MGGWELPSFHTMFYPPKPGKDFRKLSHYCRFFDMVEVNATFYSTAIAPVQTQRWIRDVAENSNFMFTAKLHRSFTHTFDATKNDVLSVHRTLDPLREAGKFNGLVLQFSSSYRYTTERASYLRKLRTAFPDDRLLLDVRHCSWDGDPGRDFWNMEGFTRINVDLPALPHHVPLHSFVHDGTAYFRLMGRNAESWNNGNAADRYRYRYTEEELRELSDRIDAMNASSVFVVFHNDTQALSLLNSFQFGHIRHPEKRFAAPLNLLTAFPELKTFCDPLAPAGELF